MNAKKKKLCGIVMPISECDGRPDSHWADVLNIISTVAENAGFETRLVSDTFESNLIHKEILQNIYHDDIVICDVSGRNPNVFFELGIRMATQKPTVIVKDDKTSYPFDTGPNRYIGYPRDLRHPAMEKFKIELAQSISRTIEQGPENSFIGQLGPFQIPDVENTTIPASDAIIGRLDQIERRISSIPQSGAEKRPNPYARKQRHDVVKIDKSRAKILFSGHSVVEINNGIKDFGEMISSKGAVVSIEVTGPRSSIVTLELKNNKLSLDSMIEELVEAIDNAIPF